ncbi:MAG TPA: AzlC family ABC transporter permease [Bdellovibrionales bacterium]|nr:AzlC family ABC transporter permease [Bdellovibrionales bacterium]
MASTVRPGIFKKGFQAMLPISTGIIPFGAVMGSISADAKLSLFETISMNVLVFAGTSQLAAIDLMANNAASAVIVMTGLIINLRFLLYSAALSPVVQSTGFWTKLASSYVVTDQTYAVMSAHQDKLKSNAESITFYFGASVCMLIAWHASVVAGHIFGNFAPASLALDYAVPLSFVSLVLPTLKNRLYVVIAAFSSGVSLVLNGLPYRTGLIATALLSVALAAF